MTIGYGYNQLCKSSNPVNNDVVKIGGDSVSLLKKCCGKQKSGRNNESQHIESIP